VKAAAFILFSFLMLWQPAAPAGTGGCCARDMAIVFDSCCACCVAPSNSNPTTPVAPVQSRPATTEQLTLLLPTITASLLLEQSAETSKLPSSAEFSYSAGALPLFQRDCALLL